MPNGLGPQFGIGSTKAKLFIIVQNIDLDNALIDIPISEYDNIYLLETLKKFGLNNSTYITPILKCGKFDGNIKNSKICVKWVNEEIRLIKPNVVLLMGKMLKILNLVEHDKKILFEMSASQLFRASKEKVSQFEKILEGIICQQSLLSNH